MRWIFNDTEAEILDTKMRRKKEVIGSTFETFKLMPDANQWLET